MTEATTYRQYWWLAGSCFGLGLFFFWFLECDMKEDIKGITEGGLVALVIGLVTGLMAYQVTDLLIGGILHAVMSFAGIAAYFLIRTR